MLHVCTLKKIFLNCVILVERWHEGIYQMQNENLCNLIHGLKGCFKYFMFELSVLIILHSEEHKTFTKIMYIK